MKNAAWAQAIRNSMTHLAQRPAIKERQALLTALSFLLTI